MRVEHTLRNALAALAGTVRPLYSLSTHQLRARLETGKIHKMLFIRPHQGIGDLILATPVFRAFKERHPDFELHFLGSPHNLAAVKHNPRFSQLWLWDKNAMKNPARAAVFIRALRLERFDLALILFSNAPSLTSFLIAWVSGAEVIGSVSTDAFYGGTNWSRRLTHWQAPPPSPEAPEHLKFFAVAAPLLPGPCPEPEFPIPADVATWAEDIWEEMELQPENPPIAIFLGGNPRRTDRLWPPAAWARLTQLLQETTPSPVVAICPPKGLRGGGGVPEGDFYSEFRKALGQDIPVFDKPGLPQAAAFLKGMRLFICPDGGLFHVAAAAGVKTLGLFFSTDPVRWKPPLSSVSCLRAPEGDPSRLSPESVHEAVLAELQSITLNK